MTRADLLAVYGTVFLVTFSFGRWGVWGAIYAGLIAWFAQTASRRPGAKRFVLAALALVVMPGCGCGEHGWWDWLDSRSPFSRGMWWSRRVDWASALLEEARR